MIYYDSKAEKISTIQQPSYHGRADKNGRVTTYSFTTTINFDYKSNPIDPQTGRLQKDTFKSISKNYPSKDSKEKAENFFRSMHYVIG